MSCDIHTRTPAQKSSTNFMLYPFVVEQCSTNWLGRGHWYEWHSLCYTLYVITKILPRAYESPGVPECRLHESKWVRRSAIPHPHFRRAMRKMNITKQATTNKQKTLKHISSLINYYKQDIQRAMRSVECLMTFDDQNHVLLSLNTLLSLY